MHWVQTAITFVIGIIKSLQIRFIGRDPLSIVLFCSLNFMLSLIRYGNTVEQVRAFFRARFASMIWVPRNGGTLARIKRENVHVVWMVKKLTNRTNSFDNYELPF